MPPGWPRKTTPVRIGSIGSTHGVKVRPSPARKNSAIERQDTSRWLASLPAAAAAEPSAAPSPIVIDSVSGG